MNIKNMMQRLTFNYNKLPSGNVYKLFSIISEEFQQIKATFDTISDWKNLDAAQGTTLDEIGVLVQEQRNGQNDEQYRLKLRFKMARNKSTADINSIISSLSLILGLPKKDITIYASDEPASYRLVFFIEKLQKSEITTNEVIGLAESISAAGVRVILEVQSPNNKYYIASAFLSGETVSVYPLELENINVNFTVRNGLAQAVGSEIVEIGVK